MSGEILLLVRSIDTFYWCLLARNLNGNRSLPQLPFVCSLSNLLRQGTSCGCPFRVAHHHCHSPFGYALQRDAPHSTSCGFLGHHRYSSPFGGAHYELNAPHSLVHPNRRDQGTSCGFLNSVYSFETEYPLL